MEGLFGVGLFAVFMVLLGVGQMAMLGEGEKRLQEWARLNEFSLERCEPTGSAFTRRRPSWRVRVITRTGERREGVVLGGWSVYEPVEVTWAAPGSSVFR